MASIVHLLSGKCFSCFQGLIFDTCFASSPNLYLYLKYDMILVQYLHFFTRHIAFCLDPLYYLVLRAKIRLLVAQIVSSKPPQGLGASFEIAPFVYFVSLAQNIAWLKITGVKWVFVVDGFSSACISFNYYGSFFVLIINSAQIWCMVHGCCPCSLTIVNSMLKHPNALRFEWLVLLRKSLSSQLVCSLCYMHGIFHSSQEFMNSSLFLSCLNFIYCATYVPKDWVRTLFFLLWMVYWSNCCSSFHCTYLWKLLFELFVGMMMVRGHKDFPLWPKASPWNPPLESTKAQFYCYILAYITGHLVNVVQVWIWFFPSTFYLDASQHCEGRRQLMEYMTSMLSLQLYDARALCSTRLEFCNLCPIHKQIKDDNDITMLLPDFDTILYICYYTVFGLCTCLYTQLIFFPRLSTPIWKKAATGQECSTPFFLVCFSLSVLGHWALFFSASL